jgi:hypothetical protein
MAELSPLEEKLAEVLGLAQAAQKATSKVAKLTEDEQIIGTLEQMSGEAAETEERALALAKAREGKKTAIEEKARETKQEAEEMMNTYLSGDDVDALDGFEFLIMAEAAELGHVEIVEKINETAGDGDVRELVEFVLPIQERHVAQVREAALKLAAEEAREEG